MAKKYLVDINLAQRELQNAVIHKLAADPGSPVDGQIYYNPSTNTYRQYQGSAWVDILDSSVLDTDTTLGANSDSKLPTQKAVKTYVDNTLQGLSWKQPVRVATTGNGTLSSAFANGQTVDGVTLATGDRILIKDQSTASQNGIYVVQASGAPVRASDADSSAELLNATVYVSEGTSNADTAWSQTA